MSFDVPLVYTRLPNEDSGGFIKFPAYLVSNNLAVAIFDEHLEIHKVNPTDDPDAYDVVEQSNPMFYVGNNVQSVFHDIRDLSLVEFARKYEHGDFRESVKYEK